MKAIILAGGSGERFWPLSTPEKPKQFLEIFSDKSLIRETFERLNYKLEPKDIFVVTAEKHREQTLKELPELGIGNVILEPVARNTAPACFVGSLVAEEDEVVFFLPADHYIPNKEKFWEVVERGIKAAEGNNGLVTMGIKPTRPETGYGYIEAGEEVGNGVMKVDNFREKPNHETALEYLKEGNYYWNSGMFLWKKDVFLEEMKRYNEDIYNTLKDINPKDVEEIRKVYSDLRKISIDYALMEKSERVFTIMADYEWSDVGNWVSVREMEGYSDGKDNVHLVDSENVFVKSNKNVGVVGVDGVVIIETENGILVAKEDRVNDIREVYQNFYEK